jgi:membrane protein implicated in regulation of membrane protease activity
MALIFAGSELFSPATFFFLPFAIGALVGAVLSFMGLSPAVSFTAFLIVSTVSFASLWKLGRKLEHMDEAQEGVGATRWVGQEATVTKTIGAEGEIGRVRLERENWRAESLTGTAIAKGSKVLVARLAGTRLVVVPVEEPEVVPQTQTHIDSDGVADLSKE